MLRTTLAPVPRDTVMAEWRVKMGVEGAAVRGLLGAKVRHRAAPSLRRAATPTTARTRMKKAPATATRQRRSPTGRPPPLLPVMPPTPMKVLTLMPTPPRAVSIPLRTLSTPSWAVLTRRARWKGAFLSSPKPYLARPALSASTHRTTLALTVTLTPPRRHC